MRRREEGSTKLRNDTMPSIIHTMENQSEESSQRDKVYELLFRMLPEMMNQLNNPDQKDAVTLRVFADEYKHLIKTNRSKNYYKSVTISLKHLTDYFSRQRIISSITLRDAESFLVYLEKKVTKGYPVYYRNLKAAFNKAKDWQYIKENHFARIKLPKRQKVHPTYITEEQLTEICNHIENKTVKDFVTFAFFTGMRLNEIVNLTWKNVDLSSRIITVGDENFETKGKNQRYIPISEEVNNILIKILHPHNGDNVSLYTLPEIMDKMGFVFVKSTGEKYTGDYFSKKFRNAIRTAGLPKKIHFHTLRHSFASSLVQKGVSLYAVKELLGHSSISTTEIYSHLNMDVLREAISKLDSNVIRVQKNII